MAVDPIVLQAMAVAHQRNLSTIQIAAEQAAMDAWYSIDSFDDNAEDEWDTAFWLITSAAVTAVAVGTWTYMSTLNQYIGIGTAIPQPGTDWFEDDYNAWATSPVTRARILVDEGLDPQAAINDAGARVSKLTSAATRTAEQTSWEEMVDTIDWSGTWEYTGPTPDVPIVATSQADIPRVVRQAERDGYPTVKRDGSKLAWARMPQAGACGWCRVVADRRYSDRSQERNPLGAWHTFCRCTWRRITVEESQSWTKQIDNYQEVVTERAGEPNAGASSS